MSRRLLASKSYEIHHKRRKKGAERPGPQLFWRGVKRSTYPLAPNNPPTFSCNVDVKLDYKCTHLIYVPFILFEGISRSMLFSSTLNFAILSVFSVRNVIIWH